MNNRHLSVLGFSALLLSATVSAQTFRPSIEVPFVDETMSEPKSFSLGIALGALVPMGNSFSTTFSGASRNFRFQVPAGFGIEFGYTLFDKLEILLSAGYRGYESKADNATVGTSTQYQTLRLKSFPLMAVARYRFGDAKGWSPEAEAGFGYSINKLSIRNTNLGGTIDDTEATIRTLEGYGAIGAGFAWLESYSLHIAFGYQFVALGAKVYDSKVTQKSLGGVFSKALLRYQF